MIILIGVFIVFYFHHLFTIPPIKDSPLIGKSKILNGNEYLNIGTLENEDNWVKVGSVVVQYYVNIYESNIGYEIKIEKEKTIMCLISSNVMTWQKLKEYEI